MGEYESAGRDQGEPLSLTDEDLRRVIPGGASDETSQGDEQHLRVAPHWVPDVLSLL